MKRPMIAPTLLALSFALCAGASRAAEPLEVDWYRDGATAAAAAGVAALLALEMDRLTPDHCRFCDPNRFDRWGRTGLRWADPGRAALASDFLANGLLPASALGWTALMAWGDGGARQAGEDLLAVTEAALLSVVANELVKGAAGRIRPGAWSEGRVTGTGSNRSFYSGHTALAFSLASATGTVATIRGYRAAPWVWAIGMSLAAGVAWLRVGADAHWITDVVAGAAAGGAIGFAVPATLHSPRQGRPPSVRLLPAPGGFALLF